MKAVILLGLVSTLFYSRVGTSPSSSLQQPSGVAPPGPSPLSQYRQALTGQQGQDVQQTYPAQEYQGQANQQQDYQNYQSQGQQNYQYPGQQNYQGQQNYPFLTQQNYPVQGQQNYPLGGQANYPVQQGQQNYPVQGQQNYPGQGQPNYQLVGQANYPTYGQQNYPVNRPPYYQVQGQQTYPSQGQYYPGQGQQNFLVQGDPQGGQQDQGNVPQVIKPDINDDRASQQHYGGNGSPLIFIYPTENDPLAIHDREQQRPGTQIFGSFRPQRPAYSPGYPQESPPIFQIPLQILNQPGPIRQWLDNVGNWWNPPKAATTVVYPSMTTSTVLVPHFVTVSAACTDTLH